VDRLLGDDGARGELLAVRAELAALGRGLYPPVLVRADIGEALGELAGRAQVTTSVAVEGDGDLPNGHRAALWFICAEALANVDKHAGATSAKVRLRVDRRTVTLELSDDGRGGAIPRRGLRGISDRVEALGGRLEITSPPGGPTHVTAELPI
jgi:signal transduction histidine kinase